MEIVLTQADEKITYKFTAGTVVRKRFVVIDMGGERREFSIVISDKKGIESCKPIKSS